MNFTSEEKELLIEVVEKHILFVDANRRNVSSGGMNNIKNKNKYGVKLANLRNILSKVQNGL